MVLGFGEPCERARREISGYVESPGWLGRIAEAANYAYARNCWARHWFGRMRAAATPEEHWVLSAPFLKIVDGRFELWSFEAPAPNAVAAAFEPGLAHDIRGRVRAWASKREKTLLGQDAPPAIYVAADDPA